MTSTRLKDWTYSDAFTPYPADDLQNVFGIAEEELDEELILGILLELNVPLPSEESRQSIGPVQTPLQVASFVARCRRSPVASESRDRNA